ncbi:MAG: valine--tRNA ligase [Candidatus Eremiobacteraeota bacterium]|nr:valine--tRNA ligase [Candidatus Eremiobacteraeota bacterium]
MKQEVKHALDKTYDPENVEEKIYLKWENENLFYADVNSPGKTYVISIPPPNITGSLHMGHALDNTIQDLLIRYHRMKGLLTLWLPGTDHAGIATQAVVEKELKKEGRSRFDLGREKFIKRVWKWREEYGNTIIHQLKKMGCSCDWSRIRFTLDDDYSRAVREAFVHFYEKGWIYRGQRIINWCPNCHTALSDLEVEHFEIPGHLYYVRYPFEDGSGHITIATTRPETILADVAVAVNPADEKYKGRIGKNLVLPLIGRSIPLIADSYVDQEFGTGALKITPGHDPYDFEIGQRHNLESILVIDESGKMNSAAGEKYRGMTRDECRKAIVKDLEKQGLLEKVENYDHVVGHCYRCHQPVEPYLSWQWFLKMDEMAKPAIDVVEKGKVTFFPERFNRIYINWMNDIKDWCLSRQLWWGHRIPVWTCGKCGYQNAFREDPSRCPDCNEVDLWKQDEDVLDTWFSSALWPFAIMGWPDKTPDLERFYPTDVLVTARDIIFLWVARMIMMGIEFMGEIPFKDVFIHPTILAPTGQRMSKSLGTGVDPLELFDKYGTDATRFGLVIQTEQGQDLKYSEDRIEMSRNFMNKIWNAARYSLGFLKKEEKLLPWNDLPLRCEDRWILTRTQKLIDRVTCYLDKYDLWQAGKALYEFFWDEFCDWYIELSKPVLYAGESENEKRAIRQVLTYVLSTFLPLAHPFIPFITEELWAALPGNKKPLIITEWPEADPSLIFSEDEKLMNLRMAIVKAIRNLKAELGLPPSGQVDILYEAPEYRMPVIEGIYEMASFLARAKTMKKISEKDRPRAALSALVEDIHIYMPMDEEFLQMEIERLDKEIQRISSDLTRVEKKLHNQQFIQKAPPVIVEKERNRADILSEKLNSLHERLHMLEDMI